MTPGSVGAVAPRLPGTGGGAAPRPALAYDNEDDDDEMTGNMTVSGAPLASVCAWDFAVSLGN